MKFAFCKIHLHIELGFAEQIPLWLFGLTY